jgi:excisionase family DNA binding protein
MPIEVGELKLYDVKELADKLQIQERTIRKLFREGRLKGRKLARKWYVSEDSLREYFSQEEALEQSEGAG